MRVYIGLAPIILLLIALVIEYEKKKKFYNTLKQNMDELEDKYLISEIIDLPGFIEGNILKNTLEEAGKAMLENVNKYKHLTEDYKEYVELWIHEIKIPIASR